LRSRTHYDVTIVGAGPAGSLAATWLTAGGIETLLVESTQFLGSRVGEFLPPRTRRVIDESGVLAPGWERDHAEAWEFVSAWGSGTTSLRNYLCDPHGHALVLNRVAFDLSLALAAEREGAMLLTNARVLRAKRKGDRWHLIIDKNGSATRVTSSYLMLCNGRHGGRLPSLQMRQRHIDKLVCFGMRLSNQRGDRRPLIEPYAQGWAYSVALPTGELMVNLCTDADRGSCQRLSPSLAWLFDELASCPLTRARLLEAEPIGTAGVEVFVVNASSTYTRPAVGPGWCLAGDCAQSMDPLSSSGITEAVTHAHLITCEIAAAPSIDAVDLTGYRSHLDASYKAYLVARTEIYGQERRWPTPFWSRRGDVRYGLDDTIYPYNSAKK
jgi:flavin-dependent dehydrogenase